LIKILENFRNKYGKGNYGQEINETAQAANFLIQTLDSYAILASTHSITNIIYELIIDQLLQNNQNTVRQSSPPPETNAPINTPIKVDEGENGEQQKNTETPTEQQETGLTTYEK
jgi:ADP-glucose pyrophosphorylase